MSNELEVSKKDVENEIKFTFDQYAYEYRSRVKSDLPADDMEKAKIDAVEHMLENPNHILIVNTSLRKKFISIECLKCEKVFIRADFECGDIMKKTYTFRGGEYTFKGLCAVAELADVKPSVLRYRLANDWSVELAVTTPQNKRYTKRNIKRMLELEDRKRNCTYEDGLFYFNGKYYSSFDAFCDYVGIFKKY